MNAFTARRPQAYLRIATLRLLAAVAIIAVTLLLHAGFAAPTAAAGPAAKAVRPMQRLDADSALPPRRFPARLAQNLV